MPLSPDGKYMYICVYTVVVDRLLHSIFSTAHTKSKLPKLVTAQNENGWMACSHSMCFQMAFKCICYVQKSLAGYKLIL